MNLYNGDCLKIMPEYISDKSVDLIITSPPYNNSRISGTMDNYKRRYDIYIDKLDNDNYIKWTIDIFNEFDRLLSQNGCILYNISYGNENPNLLWLVISEIISRTTFCVADCIIWKKKSALPNNVSSNKLTRICEYVFVICRKDEFNTFKCNKQAHSQSKTGQTYYKNMFNFIEAPNNDEVCDLNKATYSSELVERLIEMYSISNADVILDPFMGSGTTGVACINLGREFIGIELSEAQYEYSLNRLKNKTCKKQKLF